jgi:hypothetical protein
MAFDILSPPATSAEMERVRRMIPDDCHRITDETMMLAYW